MPKTPDGRDVNSLPMPKPMKQVDRPVGQYDPRRADREMKKPVFGSRKVSR